MLALVLMGFALNEITFTLSGYLADSYTGYAASALAGNLLAWAVATAAVLPFTRAIYTNVTPNVATSILAAVGTLFCVSPYILLKYGKRIRKATSFVQYSLKTYAENAIEDDLATVCVRVGV